MLSRRQRQSSELGSSGCWEQADPRTKLIQDAAKPNPQYKSTLNGTIQICKTEGFSGIYKGVGPTVLKQGANSAVRFSSYEALSNVAKDILKPPSGKLPSAVTFGVGAMAGLITVCESLRARAN